MKRQHRRGRVALALFPLLWGGWGAAAPVPEGERPAERCFRTSLASPPLWVFSLAWRPDGQGWVAADVGSGNLRLFTPEGGPAGERSAPGDGPLEYVKPSKTVALGEGFLLRDRSRLIWLDGSLRARRSIDLEETATVQGDRGITIFDWSAGAAGEVFAYSHILGRDGAWWTGLAEIALEPTLSARRLVAIDNTSMEARFYSLGGPYVATLGERGYLLRMEERPYIVEAAAEPRRLAAFPEGFRSRPTLPAMRADNVTLTFKILSRSTMPAALIGWQDHLYVVTRKAVADGTSWAVSKIDVRRDVVVHTVELPTRAADLVVAPGPDHWAILEKGAVEVLGIQRMTGLLFVPAVWITEGGAGARPACESRDAS